MGCARVKALAFLCALWTALSLAGCQSEPIRDPEPVRPTMPPTLQWPVPPDQAK